MGPAALRSLAATAGAVIGAGMRDPEGYVRWLAGCLCRTARAPTLQSLVAELTGAAEEAVRRRFRLEPSARLALVPPPLVPPPLGQRPVSGTVDGEEASYAGPSTSSRPNAGPQGQRLGFLFALGAAPAPAELDALLVAASAASGHGGPQGADTSKSQQASGLAGHTGHVHAPYAPCPPTFLRSTCPELSAAADDAESLAASGPGPGPTAAALSARHTLRPTGAPGTAGIATGGERRQQRGGMGSSAPGAAASASSPVSGLGRITLVGGGPLPQTAAAPVPRLCVQPFPLAHTLLLEAIASAAAQAPEPFEEPEPTGDGGAAASPCVSPLPVAVVEDCARRVQDVGLPSRDVLCLMAARTQGETGSGSTTAAGEPHSRRRGSTSTPTAAGGGGAEVAGGVRSLVLAGVRIRSGIGGPGDCVLALYLSLPVCLPEPLLREIGESCSLLLTQTLGPALCQRLCGPLAGEVALLARGEPGRYVLLPPRQPPPSPPAPCPGAPASPSAGPAAAGLPQPPSGQGQGESGRRASAGLASASLLGRTSSKSRSFLSDKLDWSALDSSGGLASPPLPSQQLPSLCSNSGGVSSSALLSVNNISEGGGLGGEEEAEEEEPGFLPVDLSDLPMFRPGRRREPPGFVVAEEAPSTAAPYLGVRMSDMGHPTSTDGAQAWPIAGPPVDDLSDLWLSGVAGSGAGGVVMRGFLGSVPVAVKLIEYVEEGQQAQHGGGTACTAGPPVLRHLEQRKQQQQEEEREGARHAQHVRWPLVRTARELGIHHSLTCPNIVQVLAVHPEVYLWSAEGADTPGGQPPFRLRREPKTPLTGDGAPSPACMAAVMEWCDRGSLGDALATRAFPTWQFQAPEWGAADLSGAAAGLCCLRRRMCVDMVGVYLTLLDLAMALRHLHTRRMLHRDVKPANCLLVSCPEDPRGWTCKLGGFCYVLPLDEEEWGPSAPPPLGQPAEDTSPAPGDQACGTPTHMAPEAFDQNSRLDSSVDVFALGVVAWELVAGRGRRPYPHLTQEAIPRAVIARLRPVFPPDLPVPLEYKALAQRCWSPCPRDRPTAAEVVGLCQQQLRQLRAAAAVRARAQAPFHI
ncbi:hypothetical protein HYH03_018830 [Edaphochlamys debaryana]|uniref:Protein kinase domain-containing protein n=1 Tax=Edaphochlamys debaryana TaxID=47281 RepID=A0A836BMR4_9CHLO|nr:hypothetical protein HYH03_018830 [Edaphochlamys debaryana]|eukprot:KAG2482230.1 hypothetical protein HYH03_018830 [Edaphochlamys debaryana]